MVKNHISITRKITLILSSILVCLIISELLLRVGGFAYFLSLKDNVKYLQVDGDRYRILCFGASYTLGFGAPKDQSYPMHLQRILDARWPGRKFKVINGGKGYANTSYFLNNLESYIERYSPNLIILNANAIEYALQHSNIILANRTHILLWEEKILKIKTFLHHFRIYKLLKLIFVETKVRVKQMICSIKDKKEPARRYIRLGVENEEKGKYILAIENFKKSIEANPDSGVGYTALGMHYMRRGYLELAKVNFKKAINKDSRCIKAYYGLARYYAEKEKDYKSAISILTEGIANNPNFLEAHEFFVEYCLKISKYDLAIDDLKKALRIYPGHPRLHARLIELYTASGQKELANREKLKMLRAKNTRINLKMLDDPKRFDRLLEYNLTHMMAILRKQDIKLCLANPGSKPEQQDIIKEITHNLNIPLVDLYAYFNNVPNKELVWNERFDHPNARGYQEMAEEIYKVLVDNNLLQ